MADIICPKCKKPNSNTLEICQFCGTPLKNRDTEPLPTIHPGEMPVKQKTSELENTLPGWLRDIRKGDNEESDAPPANSNPTAPSQPAKSEEAPLDLLAGLSQANDEEDAVPDWLASLKSDLPSIQAAPSQPPTAEEQTPEPLDWLADLNTDSQPQQATYEQPAEQPSEETPDWLAALKAQDTSVNAPARATPQESSDADMASSGSLPDWLNNLGGEPAASAPVEPDTFPANDFQLASEDLPGWLSDMPQAATQPIPVKSTPTAATPAPVEDTPSAGDFPDWLANLGGEPSAPTATVPAEPVSPETTSSNADFPDWLANLGGESALSVQPSQSAPVEPSTPESLSPSGDFPDWLAGLGDEPATPAQAESPAAFEGFPADSGEELPSWMPSPIEEKPVEKPAETSTQKAFSTGALSEIGSLSKADEVPDWLAGLTSNTSQPATPQPASASALDTFDWLGDLNQQAESGPIAAEEKSTGQPEPATEKPEAAPEIPIPSSMSDSGNAQNLDSIFSMEMPDWLSGFTPSEPAEHATPSQRATGEQQPGPFPTNLSPADLPSWVQAMRPIESVITGAESGDDDQTLEKEGPLAGMRSVLPAQANALGLRKPKAYSIKLQVDPTQMSQATLLENLIASEAESRPVSTPRRIVNIRPLRWVIAAVLLLAVMVPALIGMDFFPTPTVVPNNAIGMFHSQVENLPDVAEVLVVFDYQTGYAGEMEQAAGPVLAHLMAKNARLAFVSGSPTGVLMSERLMTAQNKRRVAIDAKSAYEKGIHYIDLGYLPGDAAGIQVFAINPGILGDDYEAGNLWTAESGLNNIDALSDFKAAIVLTDNPDTGRMWIEQAAPALQGKPMLMVISAQAEPMISPYYESDQVQGMVAGLAGGAVYEAAIQQPDGTARKYWDSYGAGMIAAELLIVIGAMWALIKHLQTRHAEQDQEEDEA